MAKTEKEIDEGKAAKREKLEPKVRKQIKLPTYEWALNPMKLGLATKHVDETTSGLNSEERHDAIKARYVELKGRLPNEKRHKDGMHNTGTPRPTSEQAIRYDEGLEPGVRPSETDDDDDEDMDELVEEQL